MSAQNPSSKSSAGKLPVGQRRRILFVDDDPMVLRGIERSFQRTALELSWELDFADNGDRALRLLDERPIDVVLVDAHMPKTNGMAVLRRVQDQHPGVVRILISGQAGADLIKSALPFAHQFLQKPCDTHVLRSTLESAFAIRDLLSRPEMKQLIAGNTQLPSAPRSYVELSTVLCNPRASARAVAELVERDSAIAARVLRIATHAPAQTAPDVASAVALLGVEVVRAAVLLVEVSRVFPIPGIVPEFSLDALQKRSLDVAQLAKRILNYDPGGDLVLVSSLLQDVGQMVLASRSPQRFGTALTSSRSKRMPLHVAESEVFGTTHAELGAYLLGLWGVPQRVVQTVHHHLEPQRSPSRMLDPAAALYIANHLVSDPEVPAAPDLPAQTIGLDLGYLRLLGVAHHLPEWRRFALELTSSSRSGIRLTVPAGARPHRVPSRG